MVTGAAKKREVKCPVTGMIQLIGGKWKPIILYCLRSDKRRFGEISARIPAISRKVLAEQLKELEEDGLLTRTQYNEIPPRVEYELTALGKSLNPVLNEMEKWGMENLMNKS
ncbi:transcriptional regulator, HxlR family [Algoriphagus alkaliphilus]|uniref:Transcriptional regulator, HxlR family n=1 Tax=Algoriphagus alkaliphilus TaxID=279824 RepID=A0A1G5XGL9_9BACT|nr:helix-turn-helix domain-containing protein [Algoriphagus alkaliphilus]MBA4300200.1 transcriptional regulator [Cyclobacterium sp.]SDA68715.1 transcriptional regulator, HxlR family [Algoriphagus alkaliphilus]